MSEMRGVYDNEVILEEVTVVVNKLFPDVDLTQGISLYLSVVFGTGGAEVADVSGSHFRYLVRTALDDKEWSKNEFREWFHKRLFQSLELGVTPTGQGFSASPRVDNPND